MLIFFFLSKLVINKLDKSQISQHKCPIIVISTFVAAVLYTSASQLKKSLVFFIYLFIFFWGGGYVDVMVADANMQ